jgi:hypothetical protein
MHFCPHAGCDYQGWLGLGNLRANGHPSGGPWRQFYGTACEGYFLETHGTIFHGKRVSVELIVRVIACLAEGLGIRGAARVFEVDPNTVLQWLVEGAEQLQAFSQYFLCDVHVSQVQLDELYAVLREVKDGALSEEAAIKRLERSPHWVWTAMDPASKLLLTIAVGNRTLAMAQHVVHQVAQVLASNCGPLFLTDGFKEYMTALQTHYGQWVQPVRRQAQGPCAQAPLAAPATAALCTSGQNHAPAASRRCAAPRGVRHPGGRRAGPLGVWLEDQYCVCGTSQPGHVPAGGRSRAACHHVMPG